MLLFMQMMKSRSTIALPAPRLYGGLCAVLLAFFTSVAVQARPLAKQKAPNADQAVLEARDAFRAGDSAKLARAAQAVGGHVLEPWVGYWQLRLRLEDRSAEEVRWFLSRNEGSLLAEQLRTPAFSPAEFAKLKKQLASATQQTLEDTDAQAAIAFSQVAFPTGHPARKPGVPEFIAAVEKAKLEAIRV